MRIRSSRFPSAFITRGILVLSLWIALACTVQANPSRGTLEEVQKRGVLIWGGDPSGGAPYVYTDPQNPSHYIGYETELADMIARELGVRAEFHATNWESILPSLNRKEFDVIINGFEPTPDRQKEVLFSSPYYIFRQQLTVRAGDTTINDLESCKDKVIGTLTNSAGSRLLHSLGYNVKEYEDPPNAYNDLGLERIDVVMMDRPVAVFYAHGNKALRDAGPPFHEGLYAVGIRKGDDSLKAAIDAAIMKLYTSGKLHKLYQEWGMWDDEQLKLQDNTQALMNKQVGLTFNWIDGVKKLLAAAVVTVGISIVSMFIAVTLGLFLGVGLLFGGKPLRTCITAYVEIFRGTPVLVQLLFLYFGLPVFGITMPGWLTAIIGLGLNYAAYESQVYRAAFDAIPHGQHEAAEALGMSRRLTMKRIIIPQALRIALPAMTNDFISLFKDTSTAFAISVWELATAYRELANASQQFLALGALTALLYFAMSYPLSILARRLERYLRPAESHV